MGNGTGTMKLWLDDARLPPDDSWQLATSYEQALGTLKTGQVVEVSLDYDLYLEVVETRSSGLMIANNREARSGYDVARWIEKAVKDGRIPRPIMHCHSTNPLGQMLIKVVIERLQCLPP